MAGLYTDVRVERQIMLMFGDVEVVAGPESQFGRQVWESHSVVILEV